MANRLSVQVLDADQNLIVSHLSGGDVINLQFSDGSDRGNSYLTPIGTLRSENSATISILFRKKYHKKSKRAIL